MTPTAAKVAEVVSLPPSYRILPHSIPFRSLRLRLRGMVLDIRRPCFQRSQPHFSSSLSNERWRVFFPLRPATS